MRKVIQKQEWMHKQLMGMIERKENERIIREEAWKQQEIERAKKHEEVRAQERARNLAIISFIQNFLGQEIQVPKSLEASCLEPDEGELTNPNDNGYDPCNKRWPKSEVQALITIRTALEHKFLKGPKGSVWEEVAAGLTNMGYSRSAKKCKEKWENINKYYKRTMTTIGYGDLVPDSKLSKLLACIFVLTGMGLVGFVLSKAADYITEKEEILLVKAMHIGEKIGPTDILKEVESNKARYKFVGTLILLLVLVIAGTIFLF